MFFIFVFSGKKLILCILKGELPFKMHKIIFFSENLKKILGFTSKFRQGRVTLHSKHRFFLFGLSQDQKMQKQVTRFNLLKLHSL